MSNPEKTLKTIRFGSFAFDPHHRQLSKHGKRIHLRPLAAELLELLLESPGSTIRREALRDALWDGKVVEWEAGLHRLAKELRQALGDNARNPLFIQTVPRQGYRFCANLTGDTNQDHTPARVRWFVAGLATLPTMVLAYCLSLGLTG